MAADFQLKNTPVIFVIGGPGCGKGTQCDKIVNKYGFTHLSSGELLRAEVTSGSSKGKILNATMERGELVSLGEVIGLIRDAIMNSPDSKGFLIDGYPRDLQQALKFEGEICECTFVLYFSLDDDTMVERLLKRAETSGRVDDNEDTIKKRLKIFHDHTKLVIDHYKSENKLNQINAEGTVDDIFAKVQSYVDPVVRQE